MEALLTDTLGHLHETSFSQLPSWEARRGWMYILFHISLKYSVSCLLIIVELYQVKYNFYRIAVSGTGCRYFQARKAVLFSFKIWSSKV